jgi:tetratricopeptide (TPR) repeat protein
VNAIISGRAGLAVVKDGTSARTLYIDEAGEISERQIPVPGSLLRDVEDLELFDGITENRVWELLTRARQREDALHMTLILLSERSSQGIRTEAAEALNSLLDDEGQIQQAVERTLYAVPLPPTANVNAAKAACEQTASHRALAMLSRLTARQPYITDIRQEWDGLASAFASREEFSQFQVVLVWEGLFRELVESLASDADLNHFVFSALSNERVGRQKNHRAVICDWVAKWRAEGIATSTSVPDTLTDEEESVECGGGGAIARRPRAEDALARVARRKAFIVRTLRQHRIGSARQYIDDLIRYQESASDSEHICMSLCDLATEARDVGLHDLQLELVDRALDYKTGDVVAQSQRADTLKSLNRLPEALKAYEQAMAQHREDVVAMSGYAEVLKSLNKLPEALKAYEQAMAQHPENVVAKTGYAEVLKSLNRLPEALEAYERAMAQHPENVVAKTGYAEVLKSLNRLPEALEAYERAMAQHRENVVAMNGYAEVLKSLNRLPEALKAYEQAMAQHREDVVAMSGYAEVLKSLNRLPEALEAYERAMAQHPENVVARNGASCVLAALGLWEQALALLPQSEPVTEQDWIAYHIHGMIHLRRGEVDRAITIFEHGVAHDPRPTSREYYRTALAAACLCKREYERAARVLDEVTSPALQYPANVLRLHAFGEQGDCERTTEIYSQLPQNPEPIVAELQQELHRRYVLFTTPEHDEDWIFDKETHYILLAA